MRFVCFSALMKPLAFMAALLTCCTSTKEWGTYAGKIKAEWLDDGREMDILSHASFLDKDGHLWEVFPGDRVNGASIPKAFWSLIGGPFEGKYRVPSAFHDVGCRQRRKPWRETHRGFYYGMRASRVGEIRAKVMYSSVYHFGPRWEQAFGMAVVRPRASTRDMVELTQWIEAANPTLGDIENFPIAEPVGK